MKRTLIIASLIGTIAVGGVALAQDGGDRDGWRHGHHGSPEDRVTFLMERFDTNGDGQITVEEIEIQRNARFSAADANGDGVIDVTEFETAAQARMAERAGEMFARMDQDGDGQLTQDDLGGREGRMFEHADEDGDGILTEDELLNARPHRR